MDRVPGSRIVLAGWYKAATDGDQPRCSAMPAIQVVTVDEPTPYRCQQLIPQYGYQAPYWKNTSPIRVTDAGIVFNA